MNIINDFILESRRMVSNYDISEFKNTLNMVQEPPASMHGMYCRISTV